jgi:hypothetical protein
MSLNFGVTPATNYFEAEGVIVNRLQSFVPELKAVLTPFSIQDMLQSSQVSPSAHVIYVGDNVVGDDAGKGQRRVIDQRWMVIFALRNSKAQLKDTSVIREDAGLVIPKILNALSGWAPLEYMRPLVRVQAPPVGYNSSFAYFPFVFEGRVIT